MNNIVLFFFFSFIVLGISTIFLIYYRKISMAWYYPAGFVFVALAGIIYYLIPDKSNYLIDVSTISKLWIALAIVTSVILQQIFAVKFRLISPLRDPKNRARALGILVFYVLVAALAQEFMYRSFIYDVTKYLFPTYHQFTFLVFSIILFSVTHITYRDRLFFVGSSLLGIILSVIYLFVPNLIVVSAVHALLGAVGITLGYVRIDGNVGLL